MQQQWIVTPVMTAQDHPGEIPGWFDYEDFYDKMVVEAKPFDHLIEVGVFCGKSLSYLTRQARMSGKPLQVTGVDTFLGSEEHKPLLSSRSALTLQVNCLHYLDHAGVLDFDGLSLMRTTSSLAADMMAHDSAFMAFLDAAHDYESVRQDIERWKKIVRPGGYLAGHDYLEPAWPGVTQAVKQAFTKPNHMGHVWYVQKTAEGGWQ